MKFQRHGAMGQTPEYPCTIAAEYLRRRRNSKIKAHSFFVRLAVQVIKDIL
jgi:hypothetical protein